MNSAQRVIKYLAIGFAVFLIVTIFSSILMAGQAIFSFGRFNKDSLDKEVDYSLVSSYLNIELKRADLRIEEGEAFEVKTGNDKIEILEDERGVRITEGGSNWGAGKTKEVVVYLPKDTEYEVVNIKGGAGALRIHELRTSKLFLMLGAGEAVIKEARVLESAKVETGAGRLEIGAGEIRNLDMELGVGEVKLGTDLVGEAEIDCGIGRVEINLGFPEEKYRFKLEKGLGSMTLNGREINGDATVGAGADLIEINGGIGEIVVMTAAKVEDI